MSRLLRMLKFSEPGSFTTVAPRWRPGCHRQNAAPSVSVQTAVRPASMTSNGSIATEPPAARTLAAVSSASATQM
jgi:hypothetical protein